MPVVEMRGITKRFGSLVANDHIDLDIEPNEIHALLGENGAGKTTLMKILYGLYHADEGELVIQDNPVRLKSPADAIASGIGYVSQHFSLVPSFTVAENVMLGYEGGQVLNRQDMRGIVAETASTYGFSIDPDAPMRNLSVGEQQRVEILKALYRQCRTLILDEPTAVLTPRDTESLFANLRELQQKHLSVIIITHKLEEAMAISQRVTVLRAGRVVGRENTADTTPKELAQLMVGRTSIGVTRGTERRSGDATALDVDKLTLTDKRGVPVLRDLSFKVQSGEIIGIAGVAGNGQSELVAILSGVSLPDSGQVKVNDQPVKFGDPRDFNRLKVGRIPEDRLKGLVGELTVAQNLTLEHIGDFTHRGHLDQKQMQATASRLIEDFQIKAKPGDRARTLSGGNMQKIILARTLSQQPVVVVAAQPTRGLDIGATEYVHQKLLEQTARGAGILLISEDLDEILLLSDRILVIYEGQIVAEVPVDNADINEIGLLMAGSKVSQEK